MHDQFGETYGHASDICGLYMQNLRISPRSTVIKPPRSRSEPRRLRQLDIRPQSKPPHDVAHAMKDYVNKKEGGLYRKSRPKNVINGNQSPNITPTKHSPKTHK